MRFLVDAQLPRVLCHIFIAHGHDAIHTLDMPDKNRTTDKVINQFSVDSQYVVVSKDMDFFYSHATSGRPWKLLSVRTGNISPRHLCEMFEINWSSIESALAAFSLVQIDRTGVTSVM